MATVKQYQESEAVKQARAMLDQQNAMKPAAYQSQYQDQIKQTADQIMNRPSFQYNMSADPLYKQYKQQYMRNGKLAMMDTVGQAAAMNGGYGSSYGQMAGQQAYNGELQKLNDRIPDLYNLALSKYQMDGADMMNRFNMLGDLDNQDYGRYQDSLAAWQNDRNYAANRYDTERSTDYGLWSDAYNREMAAASQEQKMAQSQVDYLLSIGQRPNDALIAAAGYDPGFISQALAPFAASAADDYITTGQGQVKTVTGTGNGGSSNWLLKGLAVNNEDLKKNNTLTTVQQVLDKLKK